LAADSTIERVSIPWLHVVREHPVFLKNYNEMIESKSSAKILLQRWLRFFRNKVWWLYQFGRSMRSDGKLWYGPQEFDPQTDVVLVSHLINVSHAGLADDFYFGNLPNELVKQGRNVVVVLMNHTGQPGTELATKWIGSAVPRVVLSGTLDIGGEITLHCQLKKEAARLRQFAMREPLGLVRRVLERATEEALSGGAHTTLRMSRQIEALVTQLQPKLIVVTHEGHAWERVSFAAARRAQPSVHCIGYQHAAVFRLQHALRRKLENEYNPDNILTAGSVSKCQLENTPGLKGIPVSILGSNHYFKGSVTTLDQEIESIELLNNSACRVCLVIPEGIPSECLVLFDFTLRCARAYSDIQFIWRMHPILSFASLKLQNSDLKELPENITISQLTIEEDIARSSQVLYRGSTAIVQAVVAGLKPIYLELPDELSIDPLYEVACGREIISRPEDLQKIIFSHREEVDVQMELEQVQKYCQSFFQPFNVSAMSSLIQ
jgi:hypothetical protein